MPLDTSITDLKERGAAWKETVSRDGAHATRAFTVPYAGLRRATPKIGEAYITGDTRYCNEFTIEGIGKPDGYETTGQPKFTHYQITAEYATYPPLEAKPVINWSVSAEALETGLGRRWRNAGTVCDQGMTILYPEAELTITRTVLTIPQSDMIARVGKLNWYKWLSFPKGTLLFMGGETEARYQLDRNAYTYTISLKFLYRPKDHNWVWRAPRQARDASGQLLWHNADQQNDPVFVDGIAGIGDWDSTVPYLYDYTDFNPLLGLPPQLIPFTAQAELAGAGMGN